MTITIPPRSEIAVAYTWDAASVFPSDAAWEDAYASVLRDLPGLSRFRGKLSEGAATVVAYLQAMENIEQRVGMLSIYTTLFHEVDTANQNAAARESRAKELWSRFATATAFADPELIAIGFDTLDHWMREDTQLAAYTHAFDQLKQRAAHVRSAEVEELLGQVADPFGTAASIHSVFSDADLTFTPAQASDGTQFAIGQGTISMLLASSDRETRRTAWENYADAYLAYKNTVASCIATGTKQRVFLARARGYNSSLEASLGASNIPVEVFHNLISTFRKHVPTWQRYWRVRRKALGYDQLHVYDIKAPLTAKTPQVPFATATDWIAEGMRPLGDEYVDVLRRGVLQERWVDVYPNQGKRMGAFSTGVRGTHPFILMSSSDDLYSMSTLAHELGHSLHSYYTWQTQPQAYADYSLFVAEVASNFNQALVRAHLFATNNDRDFQIALIEEAMSNFHRYFFIMPTLARFELEIHERVERGEPLTAASLITLMDELFREVYGDEVAHDSDRIGITWAQFPTHLYSNFYVYQYATGISAAHALAEGVLAGAPDASANYLSFLKAGGSLYPLDALKLAGVDMASPEPVERAFAVLAQLVDRLEGLV